MSHFFWGRFIVVLLATIIPFLWILKNNRKKYFFIWYVAFTFIYAGIGACYSDCDISYLYYYVIYLFLFGLSSYVSQRGISNKLKIERNAARLDEIIDKYGDVFIWTHITIAFIFLIYPDFKLMNLISPPQVTLQDLFFESLNNTEDKPFIVSILSNIDNIVLFFYYVSLYKYRNNFKKLTILMLLPIYFTYAKSGYMARSGFMPPLMLLLIHYYFTHPQYRKRIITTICIGSPLLLYGMTWFTYYRAGLDGSVLGVGEGISIIIKQESNYPSHFNSLKYINDNHAFSYLKWLLTLPLPGFLKNPSNDYFFNGIFTEVITGISRKDSNFSVLLPGVVNESIFIFGKSFFWVMPIIYGFIIGKVFKLLNRPNDWFLFLYISFFIAFNTSRASTSSTFPYLFKHFLIYIIFVLIISHYKIKYNDKTIL